MPESRALPLAPAALTALVRRPVLWPTAIRQWRAFVAPGWWKHRPFLPVPSRHYMAFRLQTMYGSSSATMSSDDLIGYLEWCRSMRSLAR